MEWSDFFLPASPVVVLVLFVPWITACSKGPTWELVTISAPPRQRFMMSEAHNWRK